MSGMMRTLSFSDSEDEEYCTKTYFWDNRPRKFRMEDLKPDDAAANDDPFLSDELAALNLSPIKKMKKKKMKVTIPSCTTLYREYDDGEIYDDNAPYYFRKIDIDFTVTTHIKGGMHHLHDQAGIVIKANKKTYFVCGIDVMTPSVLPRGILPERDDFIEMPQRAKLGLPTNYVTTVHRTQERGRDLTRSVTLDKDNCWVQIKRRGPRIECYYSPDGKDYQLIRMCNHFSDVERLSVGVYGASPASDGFKIVFNCFETVEEMSSEQMIKKAERKRRRKSRRLSRQKLKTKEQLAKEEQEREEKEREKEQRRKEKEEKEKERKRKQWEERERKQREELEAEQEKLKAEGGDGAAVDSDSSSVGSSGSESESDSDSSSSSEEESITESQAVDDDDDGEETEEERNRRELKEAEQRKRQAEADFLIQEKERQAKQKKAKELIAQKRKEMEELKKKNKEAAEEARKKLEAEEEAEKQRLEAERKKREEERLAILREKESFLTREAIAKLQEEAKHRELTPEEKRKLLEYSETRKLMTYHWWHRLNRPLKRDMVKKCKVGDMFLVDLEPQDCDLLPWIHGDFYVDVPLVSTWLSNLDPEVIHTVATWM